MEKDNEKYQYNGKEYDNLWLLRRDFRQFVFPRNPDDAALEAIGIICLMVKPACPACPNQLPGTPIGQTAPLCGWN